MNNLGTTRFSWTDTISLIRSWEFHRNPFPYMLLGVCFASKMNSCCDLESSRGKWRPIPWWSGQSDTKMQRCLVYPSFSSVSTPQPAHPPDYWPCSPIQAQVRSLASGPSRLWLQQTFPHGNPHTHFGRETCRDCQVFQQALSCLQCQFFKCTCLGQFLSYLGASLLHLPVPVCHIPV